MASDDTTPSEGPKPVERPNRERLREPPTIEGEAERLPPEPTEAETAASSSEAAAVSSEAAEPPSEDLPPSPEGPPPAEARRGQPFALMTAGLALLVSAGAAYYAWQQSGQPDEPAVDVAGLQSRLDALESSVARPVATPDQLAALERRVQSLEQRPAPQAPPQPAASASTGPTTAALQSRLDAVEKLAQQAAAAAAARPSAPPPAPPPPPAPKVDLTPLEQRIGAVEAQLSAPKTVVRATEDPVVAPRKGDPTALAVVAQALAGAVERGRPFPMEVAAAEALAADPAQLAKLKPLAETGAPSRAALARAFAQVSSQMLAAAEPGAQSDGLVDRLTASATRLVRVRPVGETAGDDGPALVARIEAANLRGDAPAALRDWDKLPAPAKAASAAYGDLLRKKVEAETAARTILDGAMSALARPKD